MLQALPTKWQHFAKRLVLAWLAPVQLSELVRARLVLVQLPELVLVLSQLSEPEPVRASPSEQPE